jgi:hypothetical protein
MERHEKQNGCIGRTSNERIEGAGAVRGKMTISP